MKTPLRNTHFMNQILSHFTKEEVELWGAPNFLTTIPENQIKRFDGYTAYYYPDNGDKMKYMPNKQVQYGIWVAEKEGIEHIHKVSPAFNYIISWNGIFIWAWGNKEIDGELLSITPSIYHNQVMVPWSGFEIPAFMPHGHKVVDGPIIFFFAQACGFDSIEWINENPCINDFRRMDGQKSENRD